MKDASELETRVAGLELDCQFLRRENDSHRVRMIGLEDKVWRLEMRARDIRAWASAIRLALVWGLALWGAVSLLLRVFR